MHRKNFLFHGNVKDIDRIFYNDFSFTHPFRILLHFNFNFVTLSKTDIRHLLLSSDF